MAAEGYSEEVIHEILECAKEKLTTEEMTILLATNDEGMTAWHKAAERRKLKILKEIWNLAIGILTAEEINNIVLFATEGQGSTVWQFVA